MPESKDKKTPIKTGSQEIKEKLLEFEKFRQVGVLESLGIVITSCEKDLVIGRMPVDSKTHQPLGILHGGASVCLAESLASLGAWLNINPETHSVVGLEINANHLGMLREGFVIGRSKPIHLGSRTQVWQTDIASEKNERIICSSRMTLLVLEGSYKEAIKANQNKEA